MCCPMTMGCAAYAVCSVQLCSVQLCSAACVAVQSLHSCILHIA